MTALQLQLTAPMQKLLVIGHIYNNINIFEEINAIKSNYNLIIFNGGICYSNDFNSIKNRIELLNNLLSNGKVYYVIGRSDLLMLKSLNDKWFINWINSKPNIIFVKFERREILIMDGGIPPSTKNKSDLVNNLELSFVSEIGHNSWHNNYTGEFGYVVSNNPLSDNGPNYFNYSMQLGANCNSNKVYAQEIDEFGLNKTICF